MTADDVERGVRSVIAELFGLKSDEVGPETSTDTIEAWDSLQHLTLVLALEEEFELQLSDEETVSAVSYPLIIMILQERLGIREST